MKKGFTLIELLSVIIILAIILVVAVPKIIQAIESSKMNSYISNEKLLLKSAELYVSKNIDSLPSNIGGTTEILLSNLITDGYIKDIKSPFNKNNSCSGYITITKTESDLYDYTPHINCTDNTIINSTQDKLLFHYKFDDFQEPTQNLIDATAANAAGGGGFTMSKHASYTWQSISTDDREHVWRIIHDGTSNHDFYPTFYNIATTTVGEVYTLSYDFKSISGTDIYNSPFLYQNGWNLPEGNPTATRTYVGQKDIGNGWVRRTYNFTITYAGNACLRFSAGYKTLPNEWYVDNIQFEKKPYSTPFTDGTRVSSITDHSINNNKAILDLVTTPTWTSDSRSGNGTYRFNGANYSTTLINENINSFTISMWVNPYYYGDSNSKTITGLGSSANILSVMRTTGVYSSGPIWFEYRQNGNLDIYLRRPDAEGIRIVAPLLPVDKWTHITVTYDINQGKAILYFDGKAVVEGINATLGTLGTAGRVFLGTGLGSNVGYHYNGYIDDVRMYNRLLTAEEVNVIYNTSR